MEVVKHEENGQVTLITEVKKVDNKKEKIIVRVSESPKLKFSHHFRKPKAKMMIPSFTRMKLKALRLLDFVKMIVHRLI